MDLEWVPRELNEEADRLSNMAFTGFLEANRIPVKLEQLGFLVLSTVSREATELAWAPKRAAAAVPARKAKKLAWKAANAW